MKLRGWRSTPSRPPSATCHFPSAPCHPPSATWNPLQGPTGRPGRSSGPLKTIYLPSKCHFTVLTGLQAQLGLHLALQAPLPERSRPSKSVLGSSKFEIPAFLQLKCSWTAVSQLFGPSRMPSWAHLGPLGDLLVSTWCLLGSTWCLLGVSWTQLGVSWAPLGLNLSALGALLAASWANLSSKWPPSGSQVAHKWPPSAT